MEIESQHATLFYCKSGQGPKTLILFHGFGQDHTVFQNLADQLTEYTSYSFDLLFHGQSKWKGPDRPITLEEWKALMATFLTKEGINQFSVLGYSLGGRPALACVEAFPEKIDTLFLVAAEGLQSNFWYDWATNRWIGKPFFRKITHHPTRFMTLATWLQKIKIIRRLMYIFATRQMNTEAKRKLVYDTWVVFSKLGMSVAALSKLARRFGFRTQLVFGQQDDITKAPDPALYRIPNNKVIMMPARHHELTQNLVSIIREIKE